MISPKEARERNMKWLRVIRAEAKRHPSGEFWVVNQLVYYEGGPQGWRYQTEREPWGGPRKVVRHETEAKAQRAAAALMDRLVDEERRRAEESAAEASRQRSVQLQFAKKVQAAQRLRGEEDLMEAAAVDRHQEAPRVPEKDISASGANPDQVQEIVAATRKMPYLRRIHCRKSYPERIFVSEDGASWALDPGSIGSWGSMPTQRAVEFARRARIAEGFGFDPEANWAVTKAAIRRILKPRANELLERASVRRLLDEALAEGRKCLVWGDVVFWYEDSELRWTVKQVGGTPAEDRRGSSIWLEGKIVSQNHGRIIVLPYRKSDGTFVNGHTKNSRADGHAKPRHHTQYVEIPFERLDGDLMIGLHGELPYE